MPNRPESAIGTTPAKNRAKAEQLSSSADSHVGALALLTTLFFIWGLLTSLNEVLISHLKSIFDLNYAQVMLIQFSFFSAYFLFSIPSGKLIDRIGYKKTMVASLVTMALGALTFIGAAGRHAGCAARAKCPVVVQFHGPWGVSIRKNVVLCFQWVGPDSNRRSVD